MRLNPFFYPPGSTSLFTRFKALTTMAARIYMVANM